MPPEVSTNIDAGPSPGPLAAGLQRVASRRATPRVVLLAMIALQLLWLLGIWVTGAATAVYKLLPLTLYSTLAGLALFFMPTRLQARLHRGINWLLDHEKHGLTAGGVLLLLAGGYYAGQQRLWPFDEEAIYEAAATVARQGIAGLFANYQRWDWLANQHPPLAPILVGQVLRLVGDDLLVARLVSLLFSLGTGLVTYRLGARLYDKKTGLIAAFFLFTFPLVMRLSATAMVEPALTFFFTFTLYLVLQWIDHRRWRHLGAVGLVVGIGLLTKYTMVFVLPVAVGFILIRGSRRQAGQLLLVTAVVGAIAAFVWVLAASHMAVLQNQWESVQLYAGMVLTNGYGRRLLFETATNRLPSALGVYNLPLIALGALLLGTRRLQSDWLILLWITAVWLPLTLTLPDHRYFMSSFPAIALLIAAGLRWLPPLRDRTLLLSALYCLGALYLFVDWSRAAQLFVE